MRTQVMGILNVTPDSFAEEHPLVIDGVVDVDAAVVKARELIAQGAHIIDVGGESTRPGALRVDVDSELHRVVPVIRALADEAIPTSVDTTRARVADAALDAGAVLVNDVSGGTADSDMLGLIASRHARYVIMHRRGDSADMYAQAHYENPVMEVISELAQRVDAAVSAGVDVSNIILDPGLGFAKNAEHNWTLLQNLPALSGLGFPLLIGASRKRFLGELLADERGNPRATGERDVATAAVSALCAQAGVWAVRVHDVKATTDALAVIERMRPPLAAAGASGAGSYTVDTSADGRDLVISLVGIEAFGRHGVFAFERESGQTFKVDAHITLANGVISDSLTETLDYSKIAEDIAGLIGGEPVNLIETLADMIARALSERYPCRAARVSVHKPHAPMGVPFRDVFVTVERHT